MVDRTGHMIIRRMRFACRIRKATDTHSEYVIIIAFPRQQWLRERASIVHYTYNVWLVKIHCDYTDEGWRYFAKVGASGDPNSTKSRPSKHKKHATTTPTGLWLLTTRRTIVASPWLRDDVMKKLSPPTHRNTLKVSVSYVTSPQCTIAFQTTFRMMAVY
jgi:hypothetical protein